MPFWTTGESLLLCKIHQRDCGPSRIDTPVININGCPAHPDWVFLTIGAIALGKIRVPDDLPEVLDRWHRPKVFFPPDHTVHDNCPRRGYYDRGEFETTVGGPKCLWKLGCKGPYSHADCATRHWNGHLTFCPQAGSPCIGCVQPGFPDSTRPFFVEIEDAGIVGTNLDTIAGVAIGAGLLAAGAHALRRTVFKKPEEKEGTSGRMFLRRQGQRIMVQVTVDPLSRIEGHYRINTEVDGNGVITDAQSNGTVFRGFERFLQNHDPRDAALMTMRICGVCPVCHSIAASNALDELLELRTRCLKTPLL